MLGKNLKYDRHMNRLTQEALAQRIGVNKMTISLYENDKRKPDEKNASPKRISCGTWDPNGGKYAVICIACNRNTGCLLQILLPTPIGWESSVNRSADSRKNGLHSRISPITDYLGITLEKVVSSSV